MTPQWLVDRFDLAVVHATTPSIGAEGRAKATTSVEMRELVSVCSMRVQTHEMCAKHTSIASRTQSFARLPISPHTHTHTHTNTHTHTHTHTHTFTLSYQVKSSLTSSATCRRVNKKGTRTFTPSQSSSAETRIASRFTTTGTRTAHCRAPSAIGGTWWENAAIQDPRLE
jgi:hypothetical protein